MFIVYTTVERKKLLPDFCISCHLTPSQRLHQEKYDDFNASIFKNLAAVHRKKVPCVGCHSGSNSLEELLTIGKELKNILAYLLGIVKEPKQLSPPFLDGHCERCHGYLQGNALFHQASAHQGTFSVRCTECHLFHVKGGTKKYYFLQQGTLRKQCARCHSHYGRVEEYLQNF